jgi:Bacterial Ig-like domain
MKIKSVSSAVQSAFADLRGLIAVFLVMAGVFLGLMSLGVFSATAANFARSMQKYKIITHSNDPLVPVGFDCSKVHALGIDRQENLRAGAIMIACGQAADGGKVSTASTLGPIGRVVQKLLAPLAYGAADVNLITGTETYPNVTQSETYSAANPDDPNQIFVAYNDSRGRNANPINISGASISTDGGLTFTRLTRTNGQSPFDNTFGDPVVLYHRADATWLTVWIDGACGGGGLGGYKSTTPADPNSWTHFCVHSSGADDRPSGWSDTNPSSPHYGRIYVSWNDFFVGVGALSVTYSDDNGATWHSPILVDNTSTFIRDVQITGDMAGNGNVYIAGMDEGGGGYPHNDFNHLYKSTDGGTTWTQTYVGPAFPGPGVCSSGYFAGMFPDAGCFWRHEGWGEPAVYNDVVSLVYAQHGAGSDAGDVYYIRSTDGGTTFGAPFELNTDGTTRPQWEPNISASPTGTLLATWYDGRDATTCTYGNPAVPCYRMYSRKSTDNGATWLADDTLSDVVSPLPAQPDPGIQPTYAGDYDYGSATLFKHVTSWTDGRNAISSTSQQDAYTDRELVGFGVTTANPGCGTVVTNQPTNYVLNFTDAVRASSVQATDFTVNGTPADSFTLGSGNTQITFTFNSSPVVNQGVQTMDIPAGAIQRASDHMGNLEFNCSFRWDATLLQVTSTNPPVGGTFTPPAPGDYTYDVNFNEAVDPASVQTSDLMVSGDSGPSVTAVSVINGNLTARFTVHFQYGGSATASIGAGAITDQYGNPGAAFSGDYTVQGCPPQQYEITDGSDTIVAGTTDTGNHCDDCDTAVALPFPVQLYDQTYNSVNVSSNGRLDFVVANEPGGFITNCLPAPPNIGPYDYTIFPMWHDLRTDVGLSGCSTFSNGCGVFTSVSGTAPNRVFNIEWHAVRYADNTATQNFEVRLYENPGATEQFEIIYGALNGVTTSDTGGVQGNSGAGFYTEDFCNTTPPANSSRTYAIPTCGINLVSAASRLTHGHGAGTFDIDMPLTGTSGVEDRRSHTYNAVFNFDSPVTSGQVVVVGGTANIGTITFSGNSMIAQVGGVTAAEVVTLRVQNINGDGQQHGDVPFGFLTGDVTANRVVDRPDLHQIQTDQGQPVTAANFRDDLDLSGRVDIADAHGVRANAGNSIP